MSQTGKPDDNPCRPRHFKPVLCAPAPTDGPGRTTLEVCHHRLIVAGALFIVAFLVIAGKLTDVMELKSPDKMLARDRQIEHTQPLRADIVDRNGVLLATTLEMPSLYANPKQLSDKARVAAELAQIFPEVSAAKLSETFNRPNLSFVWIKHDLTPREQLAVNALGEHGLQFIQEDRRVYPKGNLFAHVVGFVNADGKGMAGIEAGLEKRLKKSAAPVRLSVDSRIQFILRGEIQKQMDLFEAKRGFGLVMNVRDGEVLALTSLPDFDPNNLTAATPDQLYNHVTFGVYEMGSVFKIFNTAMLLSSGLGTMDTKFDATNPIHIGRFTIHDDHPKRRWLTVAEVFQYSSNIGSAKEAMAAGIQRQEDFLGKLGLLNTPHFELPEVAAPHIPSPWHEVNLMTIAFGHGMSVSLLQMATAVSAVVNGGLLYRPTLLVPDASPQGERVVKPEVSDEMRRLLRLVVTGGTGKFAAAPGYLVGGKTGTAEEVAHAGYARKQLLSSFVGVFPANDPQYVVIISIDQPHGTKASYGYATAGWVAAPGVGHIIERMAPLVGIHPIDEDTPEIRRAMMIDMPVPEGRKLAAE
ncbi:MAG TPA: penicillin-binding protein 2 [Stellaceae bacterium]|jgi:cell division protein FtsI (penicillin-binding protein 3)|nr:penicillin-binding protein 2 [Stellaceae bacterium]